MFSFEFCNCLTKDRKEGGKNRLNNSLFSGGIIYEKCRRALIKLKIKVDKENVENV